MESEKKDEKKEPVPPVQNLIIGDSVHYTDADFDGGKYTPSRPRHARVIDISPTTGKPTLLVTKMGRPPAPPGAPEYPIQVMVAAISEPDFSDQPAGMRASIGCWSWPKRPETPPRTECGTGSQEPLPRFTDGPIPGRS